jgi:hypothetical protein
MKWRRWLVATASLTLLASGTTAAVSETIDVTTRLVRPDGRPIAGLPVRLVVGSEKNPRSPSAGARLVTDANGRVRRTIQVPVTGRLVTLDNAFTPHRSRYLAAGIELDLAGRAALYWIELDQVRQGTGGAMQAYVAGKNGRFDRPLTFHAKEHVLSFPDQPGGMRMTGIGADLGSHAMDGSPSTDRWVVDLEITKHEFIMR